MTSQRYVAGALVCAMMSGMVVVPSTAEAADPNAGTWQMIVLPGPSSIPVAAPSSPSGAEYQAELAAIKSAQGRLTTAQRKNIDYWSRGGVQRWMELTMEMVARANLPPAPAADGTYPVPDANNPFADPNFPFGNPPYAARAYSYVTVAQYDALKVAWHYKYLYRRAAPSQIDNGVRALMPATGEPAYPSEDAVVSAVTAELLKLLFPTNVEEITLRAAEQRQAALLGGRATASDIAAGIALGQAVATQIVARANADGMRTAGGSPALWQAMADAAIARGEIPWRSQETPARPPMLAAFGLVRAWMMTPADIQRERPPAPPSTSSGLMERELAEVKRAVDNGTREEMAIAYFWADGVSTPAPPGHWNFIALPHIRAANWSEVRTARAFALLNMTMHDAAVATWDAKYAYFNPRPSQLDPTIRTIMGLPNFPSYVSGHSTFSASAAEVLAYLFPSQTASFAAMRDEAGMSRLYGGIHYRSDIEIGKSLGMRVGGYTVAFARLDGAD